MANLAPKRRLTGFRFPISYNIVYIKLILSAFDFSLTPKLYEKTYTLILPTQPDVLCDYVELRTFG